MGLEEDGCMRWIHEQGEWVEEKQLTSWWGSLWASW